jgi:hypothetical protein
MLTAADSDEENEGRDGEAAALAKTQTVSGASYGLQVELLEGRRWSFGRESMRV